MSTGPSKKQAQLVLDRSSGMCEICGRQGEQIHHRRPRSMGGSSDPRINSPANLLMLCQRDHAEIESHRERSYERGHLVRRNSFPTEAPVLLQRGWTLLTDEGTYVSVSL